MLQTEELTGPSERQCVPPVIVECYNIYHQSLGTDLVICEPYESARGAGELLIFPIGTIHGYVSELRELWKI